jgi:hypothetical protein
MATSKKSDPKAKRFQKEGYSGGRYYEVQGRMLPSITNCCGVLDKPMLLWWAAGKERDLLYQESRKALCEIKELGGKFLLDGKLTEFDPEVHWPDLLDSRIVAKIGKRRAYQVATREAGDIGTEIHAAIEYALKTHLGMAAGDKPVLSEPATRAFDEWQTWRDEVGFEPVRVEQMVYNLDAGYAGTPDCLGVLTKRDQSLVLTDWKSSRGIYPEHFLQEAAGTVAAYKMGWFDVTPEQSGDVDEMLSEYGPEALQEIGYSEFLPHGLIVRMPKMPDDPGLQVVEVKDILSHYVVFLGCVRIQGWLESQK